MRPPTEEEFNGWQGLYVTQYVKRLLEQKREELRQAWEGGSFTDYDDRKTALVNVGNLGVCKGYAFVQELTYIDILTEIDDGESKRTGPPRSGGPDQNV